MNAYIQTLKTILDRFADEVRSEAAIMRTARRDFNPQVADQKITAGMEKISALAHEASGKIEAAKDIETARIEAWGELRGDQINAGDFALLNGGFALSGKDLSALVERYRNNATMLRAIGSYYNSRKSGMTRDEIITEELSVPAIPTPENKIRAVEGFARSASQIVKTIVSAPDSLSMYQDKENLSDATSMDMMVAGFGLPGLSNAKDLYVLGE